MKNLIIVLLPLILLGCNKTDNSDQVKPDNNSHDISIQDTINNNKYNADNKNVAEYTLADFKKLNTFKQLYELHPFLKSNKDFTYYEEFCNGLKCEIYTAEIKYDIGTVVMTNIRGADCGMCYCTVDFFIDRGKGFKNALSLLVGPGSPIYISRKDLSIVLCDLCSKGDDMYLNFKIVLEGDKYIIPAQKLKKTPEFIECYDGSTSAGENESSGNSSEASREISNWINALGKKDFKAAYDLMSHSIRGSYNNFSSTKQYGGITSTKVHSVETANSSGCSYEVIAIYDSYDPSNRDGKYTQRFSINNCEGYWVITKIKNISVDYYR